MLAGLALGLSSGTKWYGSTAVVVVVVIWAVARLITRTGVARSSRGRGAGRHRSARRRDLDHPQPEWVGNPIYPKAVSLLGVQLLPGSRGDVVDQYGYTIADYLGKPHVVGRTSTRASSCGWD